MNTIVQEITLVEYDLLIENRSPKGLFYTVGYDCYIGIDNTTRDAWVEEFETLDECTSWLLMQ